MIDRLIEILRVDVFEVLTILFFGLMVGVLISRTYWKGKVTQKDGTIWDLEASIEEKDVDITKLHLAQGILKTQFEEIEDLNQQIKKNKDERIKLSQQINDKITLLESDFKTQLDDKEQSIQTLNVQVNERNESIDQLEKKAINLEEMNQESLNIIDQLQADHTDLEKSLEEKNESLDLLKTIADKFEEKYQESLNLNMQLQSNLEELVSSMEEKKIEISSINACMSKMQDDFTHIVGIGPKVSSVLRGAGINSFAKLSSTNAERIRDVIEANNPNILRLVDPTTWPEQAKLASEEKWDDLLTLQENLKGSRRKKQELVIAS